MAMTLYPTFLAHHACSVQQEDMLANEHAYPAVVSNITATNQRRNATIRGPQSLS